MKAKDALHIACAISAECKYFITTDDRILKLASGIEEVAVVDPTSFVREIDL
jgi:predicted nucleic acid-binding protein